MNRELLEQQLSELPLYICDFFDPRTLEFSSRIRWICEHECPMYGKSWACPPGVGTVDCCRQKCMAYDNCLLISSIVEVNDIADLEETLATRPEHEALTNEVRDLMRAQGVDPFILSTEACSICESCAILEGKPCRFPEQKMSSMEALGMLVLEVCKANGLPYFYGENTIAYTSCFLLK